MLALSREDIDRRLNNLRRVREEAIQQLNWDALDRANEAIDEMLDRMLALREAA